MDLSRHSARAEVPQWPIFATIRREASHMSRTSHSQPQFPNALRWSAMLFLFIWFSVYLKYWGLANFLHLCDVAVILTCVGLWTNSVLLISSQAVASLVIDLAWLVDASWTIVTRHHLIGGTEYLFDAKYPLWVRLLSLFHMVLPVVLLYSLRRAGYSASRFTDPEKNIGFVFVDPFFHHSWKPGALHVALTVLFLAVVVYLPTHLVLRRLFPPPEADEPA
jgi:hypothetical protein